MKKLILIIVLSISFTSCKKKNCNCWTVEYLLPYDSSIYAENVCSSEIREFYVPLIVYNDYKEGYVVCDDDFITW